MPRSSAIALAFASKNQLHTVKFKLTIIPISFFLHRNLLILYSLRKLAYFHVTFQRVRSQIEPDYTIIGHKQLTMLNQKDTQIIEQAFGLPVSHIKPRVFFEKIWLEIVQKFEDSVISNFNALKKELKSFLKAS